MFKCYKCILKKKKKLTTCHGKRTENFFLLISKNQNNEIKQNKWTNKIKKRNTSKHRWWNWKKK
jgi:hypothetical protein